MPSLMYNINIIARCTRLFRDDKFSDFGIHGTMDAIILRVCKEPGISQERIAKLVCIDKSNAARKLAKLEKNGFITRVISDKDKRVLKVFPTEKAIELKPKLSAIIHSWNEYVTEGLTENEKELLSDILLRMRDRAMEYISKREEIEE